MEAGRLTAAWKAFQRGYEEDPRSPFSLNNMGYVLEMRDQDLPGAARYYRRAIEACHDEDYEGKAEVARLEKKARENLDRVFRKIQSEPVRMRYISVQGLYSRRRTD
jgi:hypothetical protein